MRVNVRKQERRYASKLSEQTMKKGCHSLKTFMANGKIFVDMLLLYYFVIFYLQLMFSNLLKLGLNPKKNKLS